MVFIRDVDDEGVDDADADADADDAADADAAADDDAADDDGGGDDGDNGDETQGRQYKNFLKVFEGGTNTLLVVCTSSSPAQHQDE